MSSGQRSEGEVLLLGRPLEIFLGGCSCIEGGEFREILEKQAGSCRGIPLAWRSR